MKRCLAVGKGTILGRVTAILVPQETTVSDAIAELNALTGTMQRVSDVFRDVGAAILHMGKVWHEEITVPTRIALVGVLNQIVRLRTLQEELNEA